MPFTIIPLLDLLNFSDEIFTSSSNTHVSFCSRWIFVYWSLIREKAFVKGNDYIFSIASSTYHISYDGCNEVHLEDVIEFNYKYLVRNTSSCWLIVKNNNVVLIIDRKLSYIVKKWNIKVTINQTLLKCILRHSKRVF